MFVQIAKAELIAAMQASSDCPPRMSLAATSKYLTKAAGILASAITGDDERIKKSWADLLQLKSDDPLFPDLAVPRHDDVVHPRPFALFTYALVRAYARAVTAVVETYATSGPAWPTPPAQSMSPYRPEADVEEFHAGATAITHSLASWGRQLWKLQLLARTAGGSFGTGLQTSRAAAKDVFTAIVLTAQGKMGIAVPAIRTNSQADMMAARDQVHTLITAYLNGDDLEDSDPLEGVEPGRVVQVIRACLCPEGPHGIGPALLSSTPQGQALGTAAAVAQLEKTIELAQGSS